MLLLILSPSRTYIGAERKAAAQLGSNQPPPHTPYKEPSPQQPLVPHVWCSNVCARRGVPLSSHTLWPFAWFHCNIIWQTVYIYTFRLRHTYRSQTLCFQSSPTPAHIHIIIYIISKNVRSVATKPPFKAEGNKVCIVACEHNAQCTAYTIAYYMSRSLGRTVISNSSTGFSMYKYLYTEQHKWHTRWLLSMCYIDYSLLI